MTKYRLEFTTTIRGYMTVEASSTDEALAEGDELARGTLNYEELSDNGQHAPDVETECEDVYEVKS